MLQPPNFMVYWHAICWSPIYPTYLYYQLGKTDNLDKMETLGRLGDGEGVSLGNPGSLDNG